jgi:hypothetical protein
MRIYFFCAGVVAIASAQNEGECMDNSIMPNVFPWETEADTVWSAEMLKPKNAHDWSDLEKQKRLKQPSLSGMLGAGRAGIVKDAGLVCASVVSLKSDLVPVDAAVVDDAISNATTFGGGNAITGPPPSSSSTNHGSVFVVANGANSGRWFSYHPLCLGSLARAAIKE